MKLNREKVNIIFTDDDIDDCNMFADALTEVGINHSLDLFHDGKDLLAHLNKEDTKVPDILFLDLNMPFTNGLDSLKQIRSNKRYRDLTIAIYSTSSSEKDQEETFIAGANVYIRKPNEFSTLKRVLKEVLEINWQYYSSNLNKDTFFLTI